MFGLRSVVLVVCILRSCSAHSRLLPAACTRLVQKAMQHAHHWHRAAVRRLCPAGEVGQDAGARPLERLLDGQLLQLRPLVHEQHKCAKVKTLCTLRTPHNIRTLCLDSLVLSA